MSDRIKGLHVSFENDMDMESTKEIMNAISIIKGVSSVTTVVFNPEDWMVRIRLKQEIFHQIKDIFYPETK